jgi:alpha/beta superfamily hydrolase
VTTIRTTDGIELEAMWTDAETNARATAVLCHPHPLDGGTMRAPLMRAVAGELAAAGMHVLRFNFRGVGSSGGGWDGGRGEVLDVAAAVEAAGLAFPGLPTGIAGWSFGATTSLRWQMTAGSTIPWVGVAPGIRSYRGSDVPEVEQLLPAERLIVVGDRDQFASVDEMERFASRFGARVEILKGSDHFFYFREDAVGTLVADHLTGAL